MSDAPHTGDTASDESRTGIEGSGDFMGPELVVGDQRPGRAERLASAIPMLGALVVGIGLGIGGTLLVTTGDSATPAGTDQAAAGPGGSSDAAEITLPRVGNDDPDAFGTVEFTGGILPRLAGESDPMVGAPAPELRGHDFDGNPVEITDDGRAKIVVFLAHWCPYCQQEVPIVRDWYAGGTVPDDVDVYTVATLTDVTRSNYPPRSWLEANGWNVPVIVDDDNNTAATAFGLNAVPFWVMINADGTIAGRAAGGGIPAEALDSVAGQLSASAAGG